MNFVIDLTLCGVYMDQWLEHRSAESEGLRFDSSWGLRIFSLSHASDKTKKASFSISSGYRAQNSKLTISLISI